MSSNILAFGSSRNIGYYACIRFLNAGSRVTFLLRSPDVFDNDEEISKYVKSGKAQLVKGDGLVAEDVRRAWAKASEEAPVDLVIFTVGFNGSAGFSLKKGMTMDKVDLVTSCIQNVLCEMPKDGPLPKFIALSSTGVSASSRKKTPLALRPLYGYLISEQLKDKLGMERVIAHCAGWKWDPKDGEPAVEILGEGWKEREGLPTPGTLNNAMVLRASILLDGVCKADSAKPGHLPYRAVEGPSGGWDISRKDVAHFIFEAVTKNWEKYGNKTISVSY